MTFQFLCPQGHLLQGEEAHMGMQCQCPQCGVAFIIPTIERPQGGGPSGPAPQTPQLDLAPIDDPEEFAPAIKASAKASAAPESLEGLDVDTLDAGDLDEALDQETVLHIPCPNGHELEVPYDMLGQRAQCPHCQVEFRLRREKSVEYQREQEIIDRRRGEFWFKLAVVAACVVGGVVLIMILATMVT
jgi:hypothetical protein